MTVKRESILVVLDRPKHPQTALEGALRIAAASAARLHLASFCWVPMVNQPELFDTHQRRALRKAAEHERRRWLDGVVLDRGLSDADIHTEVVWTEDIAAWVQEQVAQGRCDLVVKSVHHSRRLLHTPTDWALLRSCPVPVLLVSTEPRTATGRVLVAVDVSSDDEEHQRLNRRVLETAAHFTALKDASLHVANVVEINASFEDLEFFDPEKVRTRAQEQARARIDGMLSGCQVQVDDSHIHLPVGKVGQGVAELAAAIDADLVVVGTGARRGLGVALLGTSAEKILGRAQCDVLAVHA